MFFDPHPGFAIGTAAEAWRQAWCDDLRGAIQLVADSYARGDCAMQGKMPSHLVLAPYVSHCFLPCGLLQVVSLQCSHGGGQVCQQLFSLMS